MAFERIELNICPAGDMPVFHCSQYDTGRPIIIDLKNGDDAFTPTAGTTFELHCRKVDDNIVTLDTYEVDGNTLTFTSTEQLCACPGDNLCEIAIYLDELCMGTLNFMLHVEPDPLAGGLESETQIYNLTEQVREITEQVIGDDYYNKTEVDDLLDTKADAATTYTKTEVDTALNLKADRSTTYTKTETNNLLAGKADASDTYSKAQVDSKLSLKADKATTYTKTETDTLLGYKANNADLATVATTGDYDDLLNKPTIPAAQVQSDYAQSDNTQVDYIKNKPDIEGMIADALLEVMPVDTASGPIATFNTALAAPLVNVSSNVVATGGNGTPDNPNPIVGYSSANITRCGVNLVNPDNLETGWLLTDGTVDTSYANYKTTDFISVIPSSTLYITPTGSSRCKFYDANKQPITNAFDGNIGGIEGQTFTVTNDTHYIRKTVTTANVSTFGINLPSTESEFIPYTGNTYTIAFGQTVYGGVLDVTRGKLHVTQGDVDIGSLNWQKDTSGDNWGFYINNSEIADDFIVTSVNERAHFMTEIYEVVTANGNTSYTNNYVIFQKTNGQIFIVNRDYSDNASFKTAMDGKKLVYELATPFDIDLTPVQIRALVGENNVYSDTNGNTTVQFKDSIQHYIDTKVGS